MTGRGSSGYSWKLAEPDAGQAQGIVVSGFDHLPVCHALFVEFGWDGSAGGGQWLVSLRQVEPVTAADGKVDHASIALGITATGLAAMGVASAIIAEMAEPFREGMFEIDRMRRLNDRVGDAWTECVVPEGPRWSANTPPPGPDAEPHFRTPVTVHAVILAYARDDGEAVELSGRIEQALAPHRVRVVHRRTITLQTDASGLVREHFGFADGLSQPVPWDPEAIRDPGPEPDKWNGIALGDLLLGHVDSHHETSRGPMVAPHLPVAEGQAGSFDPDNPRNFDFGRNGSYLVVRELLQDVAGFWNSMDRAAAALGNDPQTGKPRDGYWLGERVIGRAMSGDVLRPGGTLPRSNPAMPDNDFGYYDDDRIGLGCPIGSHMRRGNPRDGLATKPQQTASLLRSANSHRFLRRGRKFGPVIAEPTVDDGVERGMMFLVINADIQRQFEFVQQTWMMNPTFAAQFDETDPLVGPASPFTIAARPVRRRTAIENHIKLAGGEYFFLPSIPAIRWLEEL